MGNNKQGFESLIMWQKMHHLVLEIYRMTQKFPKSEMFGITSQIRRASVSVAANIVEGFSKKSPADKLRFLIYLSLPQLTHLLQNR